METVVYGREEKGRAALGASARGRGRETLQGRMLLQWGGVRERRAHRGGSTH